MTGGVWDVVGTDTTPYLHASTCLRYICSAHAIRAGRKTKFCRLIRSVSCNTFGVYVLHEIFIHLCNRWGIKSLPFMQNYASNFLYAAAVVLLCAGISLLLKKIPFVRKLLL